MSVKLLMTWDIAGERDQEYFEFIIGEFVPGVQRLGLQPAEAWATLYGAYPQIQVGLLASDAPAPPPESPASGNFSRSAVGVSSRCRYTLYTSRIL